MNRIVLLIGVGSFIGGICRFYSQLVISRYFSSPLPYGTLTVNVAGCLLVGFIYGFADRGNLLTPEWRLFLTTGFCGGFTTFSTFSLEGVLLMQDGEFLYLAMYTALSVILGFGSTYLGMLVIKSI
jgi:fluoride exporter